MNWDSIEPYWLNGPSLYLDYLDVSEPYGGWLTVQNIVLPGQGPQYYLTS